MCAAYCTNREHKVTTGNGRFCPENETGSTVFQQRALWPRRAVMPSESPARREREHCMPCCVAAKKKRLSYRLIRHPIRRPRSCVPKILTEATVLDLGIPAEKSVHDFLLRAASGHSPLFRVEAMNRNGNTLLVVIESCQGSPFVLALSLTKKTLSLRSWYPSKDEAKLAIVEHPTRTAEHVTFGRLLRDRRVMARCARKRFKN